MEPYDEPNSRISTSDIRPVKSICFDDQELDQRQGSPMCRGSKCVQVSKQ